MLLFKKILDFPKTAVGIADKRGAKRYPVGAKFPLKAKITLVARDGEGNPLPANKSAPMDWGGQLGNLSVSGANIRLHPAAVAAKGEPCTLKLELDNKLFELEGVIAHYKINPQHVACGVTLKFPDAYTRKAYLQLMEPVVIGATLAPVAKVKQDLPGLIKEQYTGESDSVLNVWRDGSGKNAKLFEFLIHDYFVRGNTELPGLKVGYREGGKAAKRVTRAPFPTALPAGLQPEVVQLFKLIVPNLTKSVASEARRFLELFAV